MLQKNPPLTACLARKVYFSSAHRYHAPSLSDEENKKIFGDCFTEYGHGHNYALDVFLSGPIDPVTGMIINLSEIDRHTKSVVSELDHKHLNFDVPAFKETVPTTENIAAYLFDRLSPLFNDSGISLKKVRLYETENLWAEYGDLDFND